MNKYSFVKYISALKEADELQDKINDLMRKARENIENDFMNGAGLMISHESIVIELLEEIMEDEYNTISWWIYDTNYGKSHANIYDGKTGELECCLDTADKLYDYLEKNRGMEE